MSRNYFETDPSLRITRLGVEEKMAFRATLGKLLEAIPRGPIIDCFTGASGLYLYPDGLRNRVVGVDSSGFQLKQHQLELLRTEPNLPKLVQANCTDLPFAPGSAAAIVAVRGVRYLSWAENRSFATKALKILQPDGLLVILDYSTVDLDGAFDLPDIRKLEKIYFNPTKWGEMAGELGFRDIIAQYNYIPDLRINLVTARK